MAAGFMARIVVLYIDCSREKCLKFYGREPRHLMTKISFQQPLKATTADGDAAAAREGGDETTHEEGLAFVFACL